MKNVINAVILCVSLIISTHAFAAQESYGVPGGFSSPAAGGSVWHEYSCTAPRSNGRPVLGVRYSLQVATAARSPQYNVTGCSLKMAPVVPNAVWSEIPLKGLAQNQDMASFGNDSVTVTVEKENYSAQVEFSNGAVLTCIMK